MRLQANKRASKQASKPAATHTGEHRQAGPNKQPSPRNKHRMHCIRSPTLFIGFCMAEIPHPTRKNKVHVASRCSASDTPQRQISMPTGMHDSSVLQKKEGETDKHGTKLNERAHQQPNNEGPVSVKLSALRSATEPN